MKNQPIKGNCRACDGTGLQTRKPDGLVVKCPVCGGTGNEQSVQWEQGR